ncbi:hypothetical protein D3C72_177510 [compost metagenome]
MRPPLSILLCTALLASIPGCSFRAPVTLSGTIDLLSIGGHQGVGKPLYIGANATFVGSVGGQVLSVRTIDTTVKVIQVSAFGTRSLPFMGLGIFPVDTQSPHALKVGTTVTVDKPGVYEVQGIFAETGEVTATATVEVSP